MTDNSHKLLGSQNFRVSLLLLILAVLFTTLTGPGLVQGETFGTSDIRILGFQLDVDTRPDIDGIQYTMTAVKDMPSGVQTVVGAPAAGVLPDLPLGTLVKAELSGPTFGDEVVTVAAQPNELLVLPVFRTQGDHYLSNIRLEDAQGNIILARDPGLDLVVIDVIDKLLVTQVTSRPLTLEEIQEKGIVIDEDNFTAMNFTVGLTLGSDNVVIDFPVLIPNNAVALAGISSQSVSFAYKPKEFTQINIPNLALYGFSMRPPPEIEETELELPPISGVIVIPGNIAFLNQFFSVMLQATNVAPEGSGLVLHDAMAQIELPPGDDDIQGSGDDPLRVAETSAGGVEETLPIVDAAGAGNIVPQGTNTAEFLVEGLREGTHQVDFNISGDLYVPALGETVPLTGRAAGVVQVRNPTFSMVLAHPYVVREGEEYSMFATVTNTSTTPANLFQLELYKYSLSGCRLADDETGLRTLETLLPGQAETFEFRLVARTTGKVTGTVFLADEGINGSFRMTAGVGDTGIPLSPDTLVLPQTVEYLPHQPDLVAAAVRMLGQAYSVATAPAGALPPDIARISRSYVFERAVKLAQAGLHARFGEDVLTTTQDIALDFLGNDWLRLDTLYDESAEMSRVEADMRAFDALRRRADAGNDLSAVLGELIGWHSAGEDLAQVQLGWAEFAASRPPHLSFGISSRGPPALVRVQDAEGSLLGRLAEGVEVSRDIPFADYLPLGTSGNTQRDLLFVAAPQTESYLLEFTVPEGPATVTLSLVMPTAEGMALVTYPATELPAGSYGHLQWESGSDGNHAFRIDTNGDGVTERSLEPQAVTPVEDRAPVLVGVHQWAKGAHPLTSIDFDNGDPFGRMVGVLFSEEVAADSAEEITNYSVAAHQVTQAILQPDRRVAFLMLDKPVGPFVPRDLTAEGIADLSGNLMEPAGRSISADPDRGPGGLVSGVVQGPDGRPIPYARVRYFQPVECPPCNWGEGWVKDYLISTYTADAQGRFSIDFVLQDALVAYDNPDIWLNETNAGGTNHFKLDAIDPETGEMGKASTRIRYDGQRLGVNVIIRGFGGLEGRVFEEDGSLVTGGPPDSPQALYIYAKNISTGESYRSWIDAEGRYAFPNRYTAADGMVSEAPSLAVGNLVLQVVRASDGATGVTTTNIPAAGVTVTQDLVLVAQTEYGTVSGRVLEVDGLTGAANVRVQIAAPVLAGFDLYSRSYQRSVVGGTYTDANGFYRFENIPVGDIQVYAFRQATYEQAYASAYLEPGGEEHLTLILPGSGGSVRGYVRDAFGNLIPGAQVAAGPHLVQADEEGYFEVSGLPLGSFTVYGQGAESPALGKIEVDLLSAGDVQDIVITLEPVGSITGTVLEADGVTPVLAQQVQLMGPGGLYATTYTDVEGTFRFRNYPAEEYTVIAVQADYGDGGMANTAIRYAGDERDADIVFRGLGEIAGRVIQSNGTPVISDVVITRKVWRIIPFSTGPVDNYYIDYVQDIQAQVDEDTAGTLQGILDRSGATLTPGGFFMLRDEPVILSSDILGTNGEVTGEFLYTGPVTGGPFSVAAFGPFLAPTVVDDAIPRTTDPAARSVDVGDIILEPSTGEVRGTVYLPDGETPVGENVKVSIQSLGNSGSVALPGDYGGSLEQPVLPAYDVVTDENGQFHFPLVLRGRFVLTADSGVPDPAIAAHTPAEMETGRFADEAGNRLLNVRLYGQTAGVVPAYEVLEADIRLQDVAGIRVSVVENDGATPAPYAEVTVRTGSTLDAEEEAAFQRLTADENGVIDFFPLIEGGFSVSAILPGYAPGQAVGEVPENPPNGLQIPVKVTLGAVTTASGEVITTQRFGTVTGIVYTADGQPLENPAQVTVRASGARLLTQTDASGYYEVEFVPAGPLLVEAFEPYTARRGSATGYIASQGESIEVPVTLAGLGIVTGQVLTTDGALTVPEADVILYPAGRFTDKLISRTDTGGRYWLPGVPLGDYTVKATDYLSGLTGEAVDRMEADGDTNTTDVYLEPSASITGVVYAAGVLLDSEGNPVDATGQPWPDAPVVANANVTIQGSQYTQGVQADAQGEFSSGANLRLGRYTLTARPQSGNDGARTSVELTYNGEVGHAVLVMRGSGTVSGYVLDSLGQGPIDKAQVTLASRSPYSPGAVTRITGPDGQFLFEDIPVGEFSLAVVTTLEVPPLGAAVTATLETHAQHLIFADGDGDVEHEAIRLQESGEIRGVALLSDATSPAEGAVAEIRGGSVVMARVADASGGFSFAGLPLGEYRIAIREPLSNGRAGRTVSLASNGQVIDLGQITLDDTLPYVVNTEPNADVTDADVTSPLIITFSELIEPGTVTPETFRVQVDGVTLAGAYTVSATEPVVSFMPDVALPDRKRISVRLRGDEIGFEGQLLEAGIQDLAGLGMAADMQYSFTTLDATPPAVVSLSPADGATDIALESVIRVAFSEPVDPASILSFTLTRDGTPVAGSMNSEPILGGQVYVFTPAAYLQANASYIATLTGPVRDLSGNAMAESQITTSFDTFDSLPAPAPVFDYPGGTQFIEGSTVTFTASVDTEDVVRVEFYLNHQLVLTATEAPYSYNLYLDPALGSAAVLSAVAIDRAGNRSEPQVLNLAMIDNQPPVVVIAPPDIGVVSPGDTVTVTVSATDDVGIANIAFTANDGVLASGNQDIPAATSADASFGFTVPGDLAAGTTIRLRASATDTMGLVSPSNEVLLSVGDTFAPRVTIGSPANNTTVGGGVTVSVFVRADDISGIREISLGAAGPVEFSETRLIEPAVTPASATFLVSIPDDAVAGPLLLTARALDSGGNAGTDEITLYIEDRVPPQVSITTTSGSLEVEPGSQVSIEVTATDPGGVAQVMVVVPGIFSETRAIDNLAEVTEIFTFTVPDGMAAGSSISVNATAQDQAGNAAAAQPLTLTTVGPAVPAVSIDAPANGSQVNPGEVLEIRVSATDTAGIASLAYQASGAVTGSAEFLVDPVSPTAGTIFNLSVPSDASGTITLQASATNSDGFTGHAEQINVAVVDTIPPTVISVSPRDGLDGVAVTTGVMVHFSEVLDSGTVGSESVILRADSGTVAGSYQYAGNWPGPRVSFTPDTDLAHATTYTIEVTTAVTDVAGNPMAQTYLSTFTTEIPDTIAPEVLAIRPADGQQGVATEPVVDVTFTEAIDPATVSAETFSVNSGGTAVTGSYGYADGNTRVQWTPAAPLSLNTAYEVVLTAGIVDLAGNPLVPFSSSFTVSAPDFLLHQPEEGDQVVEGQTILLEARGSAALGINYVTFFADGVEVARDELLPYVVDYQVPVIGDLGGTLLGIHAEAMVGLVNIAPLGTATSSSVNSGGVPERAIDGNTDGRWNYGSVTGTLNELHAWWEVDLGEAVSIDYIDLYLRTDAYVDSNRIAVLVASEPFVASDFEAGELPATYTNGAVEVYRTTDAYDSGLVSIDGPFSGRYIRIVHLETSWLFLAEVEIYEQGSTLATPEIILNIHAANEDADSDGLLNGQEAAAGTDPFTADADADPDGDGVNNTAEIGMGTDPNNPDTDGDGLADDVDVAPLNFNFAPVAGGTDAGSALRFDGADDFISLDSNVANFRTLETWVQPDVLKIEEQVILIRPETTYTPAFQLSVTAEGYARFMEQKGSVINEVSGTTPLVTGRWYHVAVVRSEDCSLSLYINGQREGVEYPHACGSGLIPDSTVRIGSAADGSGFQGVIDELRLWGVARTQGAIRSTMHGRIHKAMTGLVGYWRFDEGEGASTTPALNAGVDISLGGGTVEAMPAWVISDAPVLGDLKTRTDVGKDLVIELEGFDFNEEALAALITELPKSGTLYQVLADGVSRGPVINTVPVQVQDTGRRVVYVPAPGVLGDDTFDYMISDGQLVSNKAPVRVGIVPLNQPPAPLDDLYYTPVDRPFTTPDVRTNDLDPDGDPLVIESFIQPISGTVTYNADGTFTYAPNPGFTGRDSFTYTASDNAAWERRVDFIPGSVEGSSLGNPGPDAFGNPVWAYKGTPDAGDPLGGMSPWYADPGIASMVWYPYGGTGGYWWIPNAASISADTLTHSLYPEQDWKAVPLVRWQNPLEESAFIDIRGTLEETPFIHSYGWPVDVDIVIARIAGDTGMSEVLFGETLMRPRVVTEVPVHLTAVPINPGDALVITHRGYRPSENSRLELRDALAITFSGVRSTATATVSIDVGVNGTFDYDADGLNNAIEVGTDPNRADTDADGLGDGDEDANLNGSVDVGETDPLNADSDGDGMGDGVEVTWGLDPLLPDAAADPDGDGLVNADELALGSAPLVADTDGDGVNDGDELARGTNPVLPDIDRVVVEPASAHAAPGGTRQFTATVTGLPDTGVSWSVNDVQGGNSIVGTIDGNGLYTAPPVVPTAPQVTVKAVSVSDPSASASAEVIITDTQPFVGIHTASPAYDLLDVWVSEGGDLYAVAWEYWSDAQWPRVSVSHILRSLDEGVTWENLYTATPVSWNEVQLNTIWGTGQTLYAAGSYGTVLRSSDRGESWVDVSPVRNDRYRYYRCWGSSADDVYVVGENSYLSSTQRNIGIIYHTTDGGQTWVQVYQSDTSYTPLYDIWGSGPNDVYAVGNNLMALHSIDGGTVWNRVTVLADATQGWYYTVSGDGAGTLFLGGYLRGQDELGRWQDLGNLFRSTDGGVTWFDVSIPDLFVQSSWVDGSGKLYAYGESDNTGTYPDYFNRLYRSADNGDTWVWLGEVPWRDWSAYPALNRVRGDRHGKVFISGPLGVLQVYPVWDSDGDGLSDHVETGTGLYRGYTDTGTSPFVVDTDGDGIDDYQETMSGTALAPDAGPHYTLTEVSPIWENSQNSMWMRYCNDCTMNYHLPWSFPFFGFDYGTITVDDNGNVWFLNPTDAAHGFDLAGSAALGPVIAALNDDLSTAEGGEVWVEAFTEPDRVVVTWEGVETQAGLDSSPYNNFQVVLYPDGRIRFNYDYLDGPGFTDAGSGISRGTGDAFISLSRVMGPIYGVAAYRSFELIPGSITPEADVDADGLPDRIETGTGIYVGPLDTGTNPQAADTDADGINDLEELLQGSDPFGTNNWSTRPDLNTRVVAEARDVWQENPKAVPDLAGGVIIAWRESQRIVAQRMDEHANRLWGETGVVAAEGVNTPWELNLVTDNAGGAIAVWRTEYYDSDQGEYKGQIHAQHLTAEGAISEVWPVPGVLIADNLTEARNIMVVTDGEGGAVVTWQDCRNAIENCWDNTDIFAQRIGADGTILWTAGGMPVVTDPGYQSEPVLVTTGPDEYLVVWRDERFGYRVASDIFAQRLDGNGNPSWAVDGLPVVADPNIWESKHSAVSDGQGGAIIAWYRSDREIRSQRIDRNGHALWVDSSSRAIASENPDGNSINVLSLGSGDGAIVTWGDSGDIYAQKLNAWGDKQWDAGGVTVAGGLGSQELEPNLMVSDGSGGAIIGFYTYDTFDYDYNLYGQRINAMGYSLWSDAGRPVAIAGDVWMSTLVADEQGGAFYIWEDNRYGQSAIYGQHVSADGTLP